MVRKLRYWNDLGQAESLEAEGLIERSTSRSITIGDWNKLARAGDFDSTYLHLQKGEPALN
jgi:hypothetical protein